MILGAVTREVIKVVQNVQKCGATGTKGVQKALFYKNRKGKNYANLRLPRLQAVGLLFFYVYLS